MGIQLFVIGLNFFMAVLTGASAAYDIMEGHIGWGAWFLFLMAANTYCMMNGLMGLEG